MLEGLKVEKPALLILAAGMGSRYGGLKQMDTFGPGGETIMDYSIYDALKAGFGSVVFVIRKSFEDAFKQHMDQRWAGKVNLLYAFQETDDLPAFQEKAIEREKPWGTAHAVWSARNLIHGPFGVINADDYYGREAMFALYEALEHYTGFALIAYPICDTLSEHGTVNRGVCEVDAEGNLKSIRECKNIQTGDPITYQENGVLGEIPSEALVSMNMWAFGKDFFRHAEWQLIEFLTRLNGSRQSECYIPDVVQNLIENQGMQVKVCTTRSRWYGVTYQEDKPLVQAAFAKMIQEGFYPKLLTELK